VSYAPQGVALGGGRGGSLSGLSQFHNRPNHRSRGVRRQLFTGNRHKKVVGCISNVSVVVVRGGRKNIQKTSGSSHAMELIKENLSE